LEQLTMRVSDLKGGQHFTMPTDERTLQLLNGDGWHAIDADLNLVELHPDSFVELATVPLDGAWFKITHHETGRELKGHVNITAHGLDIHFDGFGTHDNDGAPLYIEPDASGNPLVYAWGEIDNEDHTHLVSLHGAREAA
jgi:hypothetical protein